jgi:hypothetical protein
MTTMQLDVLDDAAKLIERANADLQPELLSDDAARAVRARYARLEKLVAFGVAAVARKVGDASEVARAIGTSLGKARATVETGGTLRDADDLSSAMRSGALSLAQPAEIARASQAARPARRQARAPPEAGRPWASMSAPSPSGSSNNRACLIQCARAVGRCHPVLASRHLHRTGSRGEETACRPQ